METSEGLKKKALAGVAGLMDAVGKVNEIARSLGLTQTIALGNDDIVLTEREVRINLPYTLTVIIGHDEIDRLPKSAIQRAISRALSPHVYRVDLYEPPTRTVAVALAATVEQAQKWCRDHLAGIYSTACLTGNINNNTLKRSTMCQRCKRDAAINGERYCCACRSTVIQELEAVGHLQPLDEAAPEVSRHISLLCGKGWQ